MASTPHWVEYNAASTSTTGSVTNVNWKAVDNADTGGGTAYSANPITAGNASYQKLQALIFDTGAWNNLSGFQYKCNTNDTGTGASLYGTTVSGFTAPVSTTVDATLMSTNSIGANFVSYSSSTPGNLWAAGTSTAASTANTNTWIGANPLRTQLRTATSASPGDITPITITATWTES